MDWISVKDRLPTLGQNVLFCSDGGNVSEGIRGADHWLGFRWGAKYQTENVTHWMPLPKPAKEE